MKLEVHSRYLSVFIKMADASPHIDTTAEHVTAMLNSPHVDVAIALWRDSDAPGVLGAGSLKAFQFSKPLSIGAAWPRYPCSRSGYVTASTRSLSKLRLLVLRTRPPK